MELHRLSYISGFGFTDKTCYCSRINSWLILVFSLEGKYSSKKKRAQWLKRWESHLSARRLHIHISFNCTASLRKYCWEFGQSNLQCVFSEFTPGFYAFFLYSITALDHFQRGSERKWFTFLNRVQPHFRMDHLCASTACHPCWSSAKPEWNPSQTSPSVYI